MLCIVLSMQTSVFGSSFAEKLKSLPLDKAVKIGSGPRTVIEFSDPDCFFSRRMAVYWSLRNDVTRYVFLVYVKHPEAVQKVRYILTAIDPGKAYAEVFSGALDFDEKLPERRIDDHGLSLMHRQVAERFAVKVTPTYVINGMMVEGAKLADIEQALGGKKIPFVVDDL
jgi:thiol:disulfide interchange protein DsbC